MAQVSPASIAATTLFLAGHNNRARSVQCIVTLRRHGIMARCMEIQMKSPQTPATTKVGTMWLTPV